jgi:hypothetical protein
LFAWPFPEQPTYQGLENPKLQVSNPKEISRSKTPIKLETERIAGGLRIEVIPDLRHENRGVCRRASIADAVSLN